MVTHMFDFDLIQCGLIVLVLMASGEFIFHKMKAVLPAILASALLFLALLWSGILPATIIEDSGLLHLSMIAMMFTIIGMGVSTNPRELLANWRVVVLAAISYIGQTILLVLIISLIFDRNTAIGGLPGGAAVALIVQERARELGLEHIVVQSVLLVSVQGLVACPIISWMLRKEIRWMKKRSISAEFSSECRVFGFPTKSVQPEGSNTVTQSDMHEISNDTVKDGRSGILASITSYIRLKTSCGTVQSACGTSFYLSLLRLYLVAWLASRLEQLTGISRYVYCLLLGVLLGNAGLLPKDEMTRSKSQGLISLMMMVTILNGFAGATPQMFLELLRPLVCILLADVLGIALVTGIFGKLLHFSRPMSLSIGLNVMVGFPLNLMLAQDLIEFLAETPEEKQALNEQIAAKMVIAGFTSVTFLSTIGAGMLVRFLQG